MRSMASLITVMAVATAAAALPLLHEDPWAPVVQVLKSFEGLSNCSKCQGFAFTAGNASGRQFGFLKGGNITFSKRLLMASSSKFPAALAIAGAVADGHISFDTFAHEVFPWWASSPSDLRSGVTLRHLLSFRSGFYWEDASSGNCSCMAGLAGSILFSPEECARQVYANAPFRYAPGTTFAYNSFHLQVAGAMAAKAAGLSVQKLLHTYLMDKLGLRNTGWLLGPNPLLAASMYTTADDYDAILRAYMAYELVPRDVALSMEKDYLANGTRQCDWCPGLTSYLGHYSMCNWYECLGDLPNSTFTTQCREQNIHNDAGLFGFYPLFDRAKGMYMQVAQSVMVGLNDSNPGVSGALALRQLVKPHVDRALGLRRSYAAKLSAQPLLHTSASMVDMYRYPELEAFELTSTSGPAHIWDDLVEALSKVPL